MPRIDLNEMIQGNSQITPEQIILLNWFYTTFDNGSAVNRRIVNVEPLFYMGTIVGTEFLTYAATKLYICYKFVASRQMAMSVSVRDITVYNEANANVFSINNTFAILNATPANEYGGNLATFENFYFSRIVQAQYTGMIFNGYRITLV